MNNLKDKKSSMRPSSLERILKALKQRDSQQQVSS